MGARTIGIYIFTTVIAVSIGLGMVNLIKPGNAITAETQQDLIASYEGDASGVKANADKQRESGPLQALEDIVPDNIFAAAGDNANMLQVIFFAIFFGIGLILIPEKTAKPVKDFFDGFNEVILKMIDLIMLTAPYGVFALLAALVVESPSTDLFAALAMYGVTVLIGLALMIGFYILLVWVVTKNKPSFFINGIAPAQLLAFSTSSSAATLPVTMERVEEHMGVSREVSSFVLPIGATINMDGTAGVPGSGLIMLTLVLTQLGLPLSVVGFVAGIDPILDRFRTVNNVTGDLAVTALVAKWNDAIDFSRGSWKK